MTASTLSPFHTPTPPHWPGIMLHLPWLLTNSWSLAWLIAAGCMELASHTPSPRVRLTGTEESGKSGPSEPNLWNEAWCCWVWCYTSSSSLHSSGDNNLVETKSHDTMKGIVYLLKWGCQVTQFIVVVLTQCYSSQFYNISFTLKQEVNASNRKHDNRF